jgi:hypothetical protein
MVASARFDETIAGRVSAVNDKGIRLENEDGWLNYSKFAVGLVAPSKGEEVSVTLDKGGFVRAIVPTDGAAATPATAVGGKSPAPTGKDRTITRLAVLKAAAEFSASKQASSSSDVLLIAAAWERWVLREDTVEEDNVDAF